MHWVVICFISCTVTHAISKNHTKLIDFLLAILRITKIMVTYFMQTNFLWMCRCRQCLQRSFSLKGQGRTPQGRDLVQPHMRKLSLTDTVSEARSISAALKRSRVGLSSKRDGSNWEQGNTQNSKRRLLGDNGPSWQSPWLNMTQR